MCTNEHNLHQKKKKSNVKREVGSVPWPKIPQSSSKWPNKVELAKYGKWNSSMREWDFGFICRMIEGRMIISWVYLQDDGGAVWHFVMLYMTLDYACMISNEPLTRPLLGWGSFKMGLIGPIVFGVKNIHTNITGSIY